MIGLDLNLITSLIYSEITVDAIIQTWLAGIPCQIAVTDFRRVEGSYSYNAPSDADFYGYTDYDYEVLDRRGRPAAWLERKVSAGDIEQKIIDHFDDYMDDLQLGESYAKRECY